MQTLADYGKTVQLFDGDNLAAAMEVINGWKSLQDRRVVLDVVTSREDDRKLWAYRNGTNRRVP